MKGVKTLFPEFSILVQCRFNNASQGAFKGPNLLPKYFQPQICIHKYKIKHINQVLGGSNSKIKSRKVKLQSIRIHLPVCNSCSMVHISNVRTARIVYFSGISFEYTRALMHSGKLAEVLAFSAIHRYVTCNLSGNRLYRNHPSLNTPRF